MGEKQKQTESNNLNVRNIFSEKTSKAVSTLVLVYSAEVNVQYSGQPPEDSQDIWFHFQAAHVNLLHVPVYNVNFPQ